MPTNEFLPFGIGAGANVLPPAAWAALAARATGFQAGTAKSAEVNTALRQSAFVAGMIAELIADYTGSDVLDDGDLNKLEALFAKLLRSQTFNWRSIGGTANALTMTLDPAPASFIDLLGVPLRGIVANTNTADAPTLNVNGLGPKQITRRVAGALVNAKKGDLPAGVVVEFFYNGTSFELLNPETVDFTNSFTTIQAYIVPGTYTFTVPSGVRRIYMEQVGGGGGGGGGNQGAGGYSGGGGGAGGYVVSGQDVSPGDSISITVGDGGLGGAGGTTGGQGATGGSTTISKSGAFTLTAAGGGGGNVGGAAAPGIGGTASGGASNSLGISGGSGEAGKLSASVTWVFGGHGGASFFGGGGSSNSASAGSQGQALGSGGGGGWCQSGSTAQAGGKGGGGAAIIRY